MTMTEDQRHWLMVEKQAGRLKCDRCGEAIRPEKPTASAGWPDGRFEVYCGACADEMRPVSVDHYERLNTQTGESERLPPWWH